MIKLRNVDTGKIAEGQIVCDGGTMDFVYFNVDGMYWSKSALMYLNRPLWVPAESEDGK